MNLGQQFLQTGCIPPMRKCKPCVLPTESDEPMLWSSPIRLFQRNKTASHFQMLARPANALALLNSANRPASAKVKPSLAISPLVHDTSFFGDKAAATKQR